MRMKFRSFQIMIIAVIALIGLSVLISLFLPTPTAPFSIFNNKTNDGFWVFRAFADKAGLKSPIVTKLPAAAGLIVADGQGMSVAQFDELIRMAQNGSRVIIVRISGSAAPWSDYPVEFRTYTVRPLYKDDSTGLIRLFKTKDYLETFSSVPADYVTIVDTENATKGTSDDGQYSGPLLIKKDIGDGELYLAAGYMFLCNSWLKETDYAALLSDLLFRAEEKTAIFYSPTLTGARASAQAPLSALTQSSFLPVLLHVLPGILFLVLIFALRFGNPVSESEKAKRKITEHIEAVAGFWKRHKAAGLAEKIQGRYFARLSEKAVEKPDSRLERPAEECNAKKLLEYNLERQKYMDTKLKRRI